MGFDVLLRFTPELRKRRGKWSYKKRKKVGKGVEG